MTTDRDDPSDRFGWHPGQAIVKLVPGVEELPDPKPEDEDEEEGEEDE